MKNKVYIHTLITKELREQLKKEAEERGMPLNSYINLIISQRSQ